jgi:hypothetical protein
LFEEKTRGEKSVGTVPLSTKCWIHSNLPFPSWMWITKGRAHSKCPISHARYSCSCYWLVISQLVPYWLARRSPISIYDVEGECVTYYPHHEGVQYSSLLSAFMMWIVYFTMSSVICYLHSR